MEHPIDEVNLSETESEEDQQYLTSAPRPVSAKKQLRRRIFSDYVANQAQKITKDTLTKANHSKDEADLSIKDLLAREESRKITSPREYQIELCERAKTNNIIAVLDTGSGKTHIAVLLMQHVLERELEDRASGKPPRVAFFLVTSVALVMQQHSVLNENLPHPVEPLCGPMGVDLWTKATWEKHFTENRAIVCTAEVLRQCLYHGFIRIDQINLLVFDEAHHTKKGHPYAEIIRDFYLKEEDTSKRPKIFGMTASPVDCKVDDVREAAIELEKLLQAQIATATDFQLLQTFVSRPEESVAIYRLHPSTFETPLRQQLKSRFGHVEAFRRLFEASKEAARELGHWCADIFWEAALSEAQAKRKESQTERAFGKRGNDEVNLASHNEQIARLREAAELVQAFHFGRPQLSEPSLSHKVIVLAQYLSQYFDRPSDARCIVFVKQRITARVLTDVFTRLRERPAHLRPGMLIGANSTDDVSVTFRQQFMSLQRFRKGEINCLFATSVAEEGLDVPACNLVVRFDLYTTMIQYIQSRGRARHRNSKYLHMIEEGNHEHKWLVRHVQHSERVMRAFCEALPSDRFLQGSEDGDLSDQAMDSEFIEDSTTKARLTPSAALVVLAHFVSSLPNEDDEPAQPLYNITAIHGLFVCEVVLPKTSPIRSMTGEPKRRKALAKRSAALKLCKTLHDPEYGYLDENWLPTYSKKLPAFRNAQLALSKKTNTYAMKMKPSLWEMGRGETPSHLYLTIIDVSNGLDRPHHSIGLLTRHWLPDFPQFPLFLTCGKQTNAITRTLSEPFNVDENTISSLTTYTLRAWLDIWNKKFEDNSKEMSYWIAPLKKSALDGMVKTAQATELIDWDSIATVQEHEEYPWNAGMSEAWLKDKFLVDRWTGGRRFFVKKIMPDLRPQDPVPSDAIKLDKFSDTILNYTVRLWKKSRERVEWSLDQPVLLVEQMLHRQNLLVEPSDKEKGLRTRAYVCPQPLKISVLSSAHVTMLLAFPPILYRIEQYLIALETFDLLGLDVTAKFALEAMTKDSDNTEDHGEEQINIRPGMGANYERLEFLGDCFLKMATTIPLYAKNISNKEEVLHIERMLMLCNQNLFNAAIELGISENVRSMPFSRRTWYPEGLKLLEGKGSKKTDDSMIKHRLGDKTVADVCEAAIGAAFLQHNDPSSWKPTSWTNAVTAVTLLVKNELHVARQWSDYFAEYKRPHQYEGSCPAAWIEMARQVEQVHEYHFKNPKLLRSAFTHNSMGSHSQGIPTYERLEFLGDALLDLACVTYIFYGYPTKDPQWLTEHKSAIASNKFLGALCVKLGLHRYLIHSGSTSMVNQISRFAEETREAESDANGAPDYWTTGGDPPKSLPDIVEAYIGAIFVDSGFDYHEVQRFFDQHIKPYFGDMTLYDEFASKHPTTRLAFRLTKELGCHEFYVMNQAIPPLPGQKELQCAGVMIHDNVVAHSIGESGRYAKERASAKAYTLVEGLAWHEYKERFGCDCKNDDVECEQDKLDIGTAI